MVFFYILISIQFFILFIQHHFTPHKYKLNINKQTTHSMITDCMGFVVPKIIFPPWHPDTLIRKAEKKAVRKAEKRAIRKAQALLNRNTPRATRTDVKCKDLTDSNPPSDEEDTLYIKCKQIREDDSLSKEIIAQVECITPVEEEFTLRPRKVVDYRDRERSAEPEDEIVSYRPTLTKSEQEVAAFLASLQGI